MTEKEQKQQIRDSEGTLIRQGALMDNNWVAQRVIPFDSGPRVQLKGEGVEDCYWFEPVGEGRISFKITVQGHGDPLTIKGKNK